MIAKRFRSTLPPLIDKLAQAAWVKGRNNISDNIKACISSTRFSVKVNDGEAVSYFASFRGIQQGDLLSLFLFGRRPLWAVEFSGKWCRFTYQNNMKKCYSTTYFLQMLAMVVSWISITKRIFQLVFDSWNILHPRIGFMVELVINYKHVR